MPTNMSRLYNYFSPEKLIFLDGATGTELMKRGFKQGESPELWSLDNVVKIKEIEENYIKSGSNIVYVPSFSANRIKLAEFGRDNDVFEINKTLAINTKKIVGTDALAFGDLSPTGQFLAPLGELTFNELIEIYREQAEGLIAGGVDGFIVETIFDLQEARAAAIAIRSISNLPIMISMTFEENNHTINGNPAVSCLLALQELDIDAFGCNCSTGPDNMVQVIKELKPYAKIPLIAKPNAGLPQFINGETVFTLNAEDFATQVTELAKAGANIIGGCCGTTPEHISQVTKSLKSYHISEELKPKFNLDNLYASAREYVDISLLTEEEIGKSINLATDVNLDNDANNLIFDDLIDLAMDDISDDCKILEINLTNSKTEQNQAAIEKMILELSGICTLPIIFKTKNDLTITTIKHCYCGK